MDLSHQSMFLQGISPECTLDFPVRGSQKSIQHSHEIKYQQHTAQNSICLQSKLCDNNFIKKSKNNYNQIFFISIIKNTWIILNFTCPLSTKTLFYHGHVNIDARYDCLIIYILILKEKPPQL